MRLVQGGLILTVCIALVVSISIENELSERKKGKGKGKKPAKKPVKPPSGGKGNGGKGTGSEGLGTGSGGNWVDAWKHIGQAKEHLMALEVSSKPEARDPCVDGKCPWWGTFCCEDHCCPSNWVCGCFGCWNPQWGIGPVCPPDERKKGKGKKPAKKPIKPPSGGKGNGGKGTGSEGSGSGSGSNWVDAWKHIGQAKEHLMALEVSSNPGARDPCVNGKCPWWGSDCCKDVCCPLNWYCGCLGCWNPQWGIGPVCPPEDVCKPQGACPSVDSCEPNQHCCLHPGVLLGECYPDNCPCPSCDSDDQCPEGEICCPSSLLGGLNHCAVSCSEETTSTPGTGVVAPGAEFHSPNETYHTNMLEAAAALTSDTCITGSAGCTGNCQNDPANSYYSEVLFDNARVILANGIPYHEYEHDATNPNPNQACEHRIVLSLPLNPAKGTFQISNMGPVGISVSGGFIFNHLSNANGDLAVPNEGPSLDSCHGHSEPLCRYHYHDINLDGACTHEIEYEAAVTLADATCHLIGWMLDGFPLYVCKDAGGDYPLKSCYVGSGDNVSGYTFTPSGACHLDEASGYDFPEGYGYLVTDTFPWVPMGYMGDDVRDICYLGESAGGGMGGKGGKEGSGKGGKEGSGKGGKESSGKGGKEGSGKEGSGKPKPPSKGKGKGKGKNKGKGR